MPIEIVPAGATAIVNEKDKHHGEDKFATLRYDIRNAEGNIKEGVKSTESTLRYDIRNTEGNIKEGVKSTESTLRHDTLDGTRIVQGDIKDARWDLEQTAERYGSSAAVQGALTDSKVQNSELNTQKGMDRGFAETMLRGDLHYEKTQKQVSDAATATVVGFKDASALAYQVQGQALLEAAKNAAAASVQATSNFNLSQVQAQTFAYEAQLQAQTVAAQAAAKAAECCCELKTAIVFDGQKTRDLLNSMKEQDLRDRAQRSETALAAFFAAKVAPTSPVVG